ncbi:hypothetical protein DPMN_087188 [Dreissena polymorpha]|uniref:Uncharacterized protein n=1 Tax=Dreissena polymorpha TaxID=45954 RepID=A0A9D4QW49_DREPO|nr:hypothetical protein DPMN_087188 [Dreissena polymorpha]
MLQRSPAHYPEEEEEARLLMLYKIENEKVAINKEHRLIPPRRLTRGMHEENLPNSIM